MPVFESGEAALDIGSGAIVTSQLANSSVTSVVIDGGAITTGHFGANVVTAGVMANSSVTSLVIAAGAVSTLMLQTAAVTANAMGNSSVTSTAIAAQAVTTSMIAVGAVNTAQLASASVTAAILANSSVTQNAIAASSVTLGNVMAEGSVNTSGNTSGLVGISHGLATVPTVAFAQHIDNNVANVGVLKITLQTLTTASVAFFTASMPLTTVSPTQSSISVHFGWVAFL